MSDQEEEEIFRHTLDCIVARALRSLVGRDGQNTHWKGAPGKMRPAAPGLRGGY